MKIFAIIFAAIPFAILISSGNKNFIISIICGAIAAWVAVPTEFLLNHLLLGTNLASYVLVQAFIFAAIPEEMLKFYILTSTKLKIQNPKEIVTLMMLAGLGFGTIENIFYISRFSETGNDIAVFLLLLIRYIMPLMMHILCGIIASTGIIYKNISKFGGLTIAIIFHGLYDAILMKEIYVVSNQISLAILIVGALISAVVLRSVKYRNQRPIVP